MSPTRRPAYTLLRRIEAMEIAGTRIQAVRYYSKNLQTSGHGGQDVKPMEGQYIRSQSGLVSGEHMFGPAFQSRSNHPFSSIAAIDLYC